MQRFRAEEWFWIGVFALAVVVMGVVTFEPWLSR